MVFINKSTRSKLDGAPTRRIVTTSNLVQSSLLILGQAVGFFFIKES